MTLRTTNPAFLIAGALAFASLSGLADPAQPATTSQWFGEPVTSARALVLIAHGLNLKPSRMEALAREICDEESGLACRIVTLPGHAPPGSAGDAEFERLLRFRHAFRHAFRHDSGTAVADAWKKTMLAELDDMRALAGQRPVYFLGYSLGALVGLWAERVASVSSGAFTKMVLLAPPVATHFYTRLAAWIPGPGHWRIPSRNHVEYRVHGSTTLAAYRAMHALQSEVRVSFASSTAAPDSSTPDTLVLVNPLDELVDAEDLRTMIETRAKWQGARIEDIGPIDPTLSPVYQHLFIDEPSMGTRAWDGLRRRIRQFLVSE